MTRKIGRKSANTEIRILPAAIGVGAILFALKAGGIAFGASAAETEGPQASQAETAVAAQSPQAPQAAPAANVEKQPLAAPEGAGSSSPVTLPNDPRAAIEERLPNRAGKPLIEPPETPLLADVPSGDVSDGGPSPAEMDLLTSLSERRNALDERQREIDLKASVMSAAEKRVDDKIAQLKALQANIEKLLGQRDTKEAESLDGLVRIYAAMKPKDAARIFESLDNTVRIGVAGRMKPDTMAGIMTSLPAAIAQKMTVELAGRYKMTAGLADAASSAVPSATPSATPGASP